MLMFESQIQYLTILAGTPSTTAQDGTSFVTTAPAAMIAPSPIVTREPIHTLLPICIGFGIVFALCAGFYS